MTRTTRLALAALLGLAACSAIVDPDKLKPTAPATLRAFCLGIGQVFLDKVLTCFSILPEYANTTFAGPPCAVWDNAVQRGRLRYEPSRANACSAALQALGCQGIFAGPQFELVLDSCRDALVGTVAPGGACGDDAECQRGSFCDQSGGVCPYTCRSYSQLGEACAFPARCAPGLYCDRSAAPDLCQQWSPASAVNGPCGTPGTYCDEGLYCPFLGNTCALRKGLGQTCAGATSFLLSDCQVGLFCVQGACRVPKQPGSPCVPGDLECVGGSACLSPGNNCVVFPRPTSPVRDCGLLAGQVERVECIDGWCNLATASAGTCDRFIPVGSPCTAADSCGPNAFCNTVPIVPACASDSCVF